MSIIETDLGAATAYAEAVEAGYKGTREEFGKLLANFVGSATEVEENRTAVEKIKEELENTVNVFDQHVSDKTDEANKKIKEATDDVKGKAIESVESARDEGKSAIAAAVEEGKKNFVTDKNLEEEGRAADAKAVGDVVGQLKEDLGEIAKQYCGLYFLKGTTKKEYKIARNIKYIEFIGDVDFAGCRVNIVVNTSTVVKRLLIANEDGNIFGVNNGYDEKTGYNYIYLTSDKTKGILIKYDWDNHTENLNELYSNAHIVLTGKNSIPTDINKLYEAANKNIEMDNLVNSDIYAIKTDIYTATNEYIGIDHAGAYLTPIGTINAKQDSSFSVKTYQVIKGETIIIKGNAKLLSDTYPICAFSELDFADGISVEPIKKATTVIKKYYFAFTPTKNGYIHCARSEGYGEIGVYYIQNPVGRMQEFADLLDEKRVKEADVVGTDYEKRYISENGLINIIKNEVFYVAKYHVEAHKTYNIYGKSIAVNADIYPLASFSTSDYDGTTSIETKIIISGDGQSTTKRNYEVLYTPNDDGYIYIAYIADGRSKLNVASTTNVSGLTYKLTNSNNDVVKIQTFGDSITDEVWRADKTTWATLLADLIPQRNIDLMNSAVGGAGIGHGYSNGGGRYPEKTQGNYVYDLMTDGTLRTDNDIVIMFVGTNNWAGNSALGQWGDDTVSTFYGSAKLICDYITKNTKALFIVCTPIGRYNSADEARGTNADGEPVNNQNKTLRDYCDALVKTCHFYGVPVLDLNYDLGWNRNNIKNFSGDGLHPNANSSKYIARIIASEVKRHLGI